MNKHEYAPAAPQSVAELEDLLTVPTPEVVELMRRLSGNLIVLGAGGKMGLTLARMARRAAVEANATLRVIAVSRFSDAKVRERLDACGVETIGCDLLNESDVAALPDAANVVYMPGFKFGADHNPEQAWAINCYLPSLVARRFAASRIAAFSTGNVYGMTSVASGGSREDDPLRPAGEYSVTALGRERMFEFFSRREKIPVVLLRLNYSCELRYGVLVDMARLVLAGQPIDVTMGYLNAIWQGDACAMSLLALEHAAVPPRVLNIAGPEVLRVRDLCEQLARLMNRDVHITGTEADDAFLSSAERAFTLVGRPHTRIIALLAWTADWVHRGGESLNKPTHFQVRDGVF